MISDMIAWSTSLVSSIPWKADSKPNERMGHWSPFLHTSLFLGSLPCPWVYHASGSGWQPGHKLPGWLQLVLTEVLGVHGLKKQIVQVYLLNQWVLNLGSLQPKSASFHPICTLIFLTVPLYLYHLVQRWLVWWVGELKCIPLEVSLPHCAPLCSKESGFFCSFPPG